MHLRAWPVVAVALLSGCAAGESGDGPGYGGAAGAPSDASGGAENDGSAGASAQSGAGGGSGNDSSVDGHSDGPLDATVDSGSDVTMDSDIEAATDSSSDGSWDALGDSKPDTVVDASFDVVKDASEAGDSSGAKDVLVEEAQAAGGEVWVEIDYSSAYTPESPDWTFSPTPGWGEPQWAQPGKSWPEAWDRWNNMSVENDPIGTSLTIGSSSELQLMIGLEELLSYTSMSVRLEGRSKATSLSVQFDVYNPLNNCGTSGSMSQDWTVHVVELDLGTCAVVGAGVQAVRVSPSNGTLALVRMRVTLHGATW